MNYRLEGGPLDGKIGEYEGGHSHRFRVYDGNLEVYVCTYRYERVDGDTIIGVYEKTEHQGNAMESVARAMARRLKDDVDS